MPPSLRNLTATLGLLVSLIFPVLAQATAVSIEFSAFTDPRRVGVDSFVPGTDNLIVGFDYFPNGTPLPPSTIIDNAFQSLGLRFSAVLTQGTYAGSSANTQALGLPDIPSPSISLPNILSGVNPELGPGATGLVAGTAILIVDFLDAFGGPGQVFKVGAFNDLWYGYNTLTAYSGSGGTGSVLGSVSAAGAGDFFGLSSTVGIGSITFSGYSTEIDDLVFGPVSARVSEPSMAALLALGLTAIGTRQRKVSRERKAARPGGA